MGQVGICQGPGEGLLAKQALPDYHQQQLAAMQECRFKVTGTLILQLKQNKKSDTVECNFVSFICPFN